MNIAQVIMHLFPQASPMTDFIVQDDSDGEGPYIAQWNIDEPQPTAAQIQIAWEAIEALPVPPPEPNILEQLQQENQILGQQLVALEIRFMEAGL